MSTAGLSTVGQLISAIKTDCGGKVTAELNSSGNGITLVDNTTSPGSITVTADPNSTAAADLGLIPSGQTAVTSSAKGFASATVELGASEQQPAHPIQNGGNGRRRADHLPEQRDAQSAGLRRDQRNLDLQHRQRRHHRQPTRARGGRGPGGRSRGERILRNPRHATDPTNDGSGAVSSTTLLTPGPLYAVGGSPAQVSGTDANPQETAGVFNALLRLTTALNSNDQAEIQRDAGQLQQASQNLSVTQASLGAEEQTLSSVQTQLTLQNTQLQTLLSNNQDVDLATVISDLTAQQVAYQASLQTMAQMFKMSLLNYL